MSRRRQGGKGGARRPILDALGPGLVTGAADDDPSGIGTYSQIGAQFGFQLAWTMVFALPLMAAIQQVSAYIGAVTGRGLAGNLKRHYPAWLLRSVLVLLVVANVANLGADLSAMGEVTSLIVPGPVLLFTAIFGVVSTLLEIFVSYSTYSHVLKWATLSLFAYVAVAIVARIPWDIALAGIFIPSFSFAKEQAMALVAVFGTTISPYLFFWQADQEVEEQRRLHTQPLYRHPATADTKLRQIRADTWVGMGFSQLVALSIIIATAATLHAHGITDIQSATQAAQALRPIAGTFAFLLFALGIIGTGLLAVPVLAGSAAYAASEVFGWKEGLDRKPMQAKAFYGVIAVAGAGGVLLSTIGINPMKALYWSAVLNGLLAPPLMVLVMLLARDRAVMGELRISLPLATMGWLATAVMGGVAALFLFA